MKTFACAKKVVLAVGLAVCAIGGMAADAAAPGMTLADARQRISAIVEDPDEMTTVMEALSAEDQVTFLGEINAAIARLPGSVESRTATLLNVDNAALRSAKQGNLGNLVAEVFATSFVEALPILSERFAEDLFSRDAVQNNKPTDEQYVKIVQETMDVVNKRVAEVDGGDVRSAFVALMFIRASGQTPSPELIKAIASMVPEKSREAAVTEWLPEALGLDGKEQSYDALMAVANGGVIPVITRTLEIAGPQFQDVLLSDLTGFNTEPFMKTMNRTPITDAIFNPLKLGRPIGGNSNVETPVPVQEKPYEGQTTH